MPLPTDNYDDAIALVTRALDAFCGGDGAAGESLLRDLDVPEIERDRARLRLLGVSGEPSPPCVIRAREERGSVPVTVKRAVQARDRFYCRYTGRRLIDTSVFRALSQLSSAFHFDEHHSVRVTARGLPGHPMVRTHGAAYEHVVPLSSGGRTTIDNIVLTSVELNEAMNTRRLPLVSASISAWTGLCEYGPRLASLPRPLRKVPAKPDPVRPIPSVRAWDGPLSRQSFDTKFSAFWDRLKAELISSRTVVFSPHLGNPRRVCAVDDDVVRLVETTDRSGVSVCTRNELHQDFWKLVNDPNWRSDPLPIIRARHGIRNLVEFKRAMFERFEISLLSNDP